MGVPDAAHGRFAQPHQARHAARTPVSGVGRFFLGGFAYDRAVTWPTTGVPLAAHIWPAPVKSSKVALGARNRPTSSAEHYQDESTEFRWDGSFLLRSGAERSRGPCTRGVRRQNAEVASVAGRDLRLNGMGMRKVHIFFGSSEEIVG
jgi:hypothetical protein